MDDSRLTIDGDCRKIKRDAQELYKEFGKEVPKWLQ